jgi:hypothetical protein
VCSLTCLTILLALPAAPAPLPKTGVAEAVLGPQGLPLPAARRHLLELAEVEVLYSSKLSQLACLRGEKDPVAWVAARLSVEADPASKGVRVRLGGCQPREALALLSAVVGAYAAEHSRKRDRVERLMKVAREEAAAGGIRAAKAQDLLVLYGHLSRRLPAGPAIIRGPKVLAEGHGR